MYGLKIMYYDWPQRPERMGFPKNRKNVAENIVPGTQCLVYLTAPIKRIVAATKITGTPADGLKEWPNHDQEFPRWPYTLTHELITGFKRGIPLEEIRQGELEKFGPRPGDSYIPITEATYKRLFKFLEGQEDFDWAKWLEENV